MITKTFKNLSLLIAVGAILFMFTACNDIPWRDAFSTKNGTWTITSYDGESGAIVSDKEYSDSGERVLLAAKPKNGFVITSIKIFADDGNEIDDFEDSSPIFTFIMPPCDVTITGVFEVKREEGGEVTPAPAPGNSGFFVYFDGAGATTPPSPTTQVCKGGGTVSLPSPPKREEQSGDNYIFTGWYCDAARNGAQFTESTTVTADIRVYAKWVLVPTSDGWNYDPDTVGMKKSLYQNTNTAQPLKIPVTTGTYTFELWGASGGNSRIYPSDGEYETGGKGGYIKASCSFNTDDTLYIEIGQKGADGTTSSATPASYGGGGRGGAGFTGFAGGGAGGGATIVRKADTTRILVAGGGGGGSSNTDNSKGGYGSGNGNAGPGKSGGGSDIPGGINDSGIGDNGRDGFSSGQIECNGAGGGGGGYKGGAAQTATAGFNAGGGGGSGYHDTSIWTDVVAYKGDESMPNPDGNGVETGHTGDGYARVTWSP